MRKVIVLRGKHRVKDGRVQDIAWFHGFFTVADEDGTEPMAIIEFNDGSCDTIHVRDFKFLCSPEYTKENTDGDGQ